MKILSGLLMIVLLLACSRNQPETLSGAGKRVISLAPHMTEIVYALEAEDGLLAVSDYCFYPPQARAKEHIGGLINPNRERIVALKPDIVLGLPSNQMLADQLAGFGISSCLLPNETVDDVLATIDSVGKLLNRRRQAVQVIKGLKDSLNACRPEDDGRLRRPLRAMLVVGREPGTTRNLTVAGANTFIDSLWTLTGGSNSFHDMPARYAQINHEAVLDRDIDVIIEIQVGLQDSLYRLSRLDEWQALRALPAVREGRVYRIEGDYTLIPGPRLYRLARSFVRIRQQVREKISGQVLRNRQI